MKINIKIFFALAALVVGLSFTSCGDKNKSNLSISENTVAFYQEGGTKTIDITSNTSWTITKDDNQSWYELSTTSGEKDARLSISVPVLEGASNRSATITIATDDGNKSESIIIKQNGHNESLIAGTVWRVFLYERWNTDFYNQLIESSYTSYNYNIQDTTDGFDMYFLRNNTGIQVNRSSEETVYYTFDYEYDTIDLSLYIAFESDDEEAPEAYNAIVNTLDDSTFVFTNEYKDHWFEKASMKKMATIEDNKANRTSGMARAKKTKGSPIFNMK